MTALGVGCYCPDARGSTQWALASEHAPLDKIRLKIDCGSTEAWCASGGAILPDPTPCPQANETPVGYVGPLGLQFV